MARGRRESTWMVIRRCLAIIRRVQRGPASREDLLDVVRVAGDKQGFGSADPEESALKLRLDKDLRRIRERLMVDVYYDAQVDGYIIKDTWLPLLDLPDDDLETLAWLEEAFDCQSPKHDQVHALARRLRFYLAPERVAVIDRARSALEIDLRQRDEDEIRPAIWSALTKAYVTRRQLELLYLSPAHAEEEERRHIVEPYRPYHFDTTRGHYYIKAYCREVTGPHGRWCPNKYITYRVGRIREAEVLPTKLSPTIPKSPTYPVEYALAPHIARLGVTRHAAIEIHNIERGEDGGAVVRGETDSVFWTVQALLHYGADCEVLGGVEMRREMKRAVTAMASVYEATSRRQGETP